MKKILIFLKDNKKAITSILVAIFALLCAIFGVTSCAPSLKATVTNKAEGTTTSINISGEQNSNLSVTPDINISIYGKEQKKYK